MSRISKWIEDGVHLFRDVGVAGPYVGSRDHQVLGESSVSVHAYALGILTVLFVAFQTVPALAAGDVAFTGNQVSDIEAFHACSNLNNLHIHVRR